MVTIGSDRKSPPSNAQQFIFTHHPQNAFVIDDLLVANLGNHAAMGV
jgi:hypothetical protein